MSEENTAESNGSRSFQERVFARFDAVDNRLNVMDTRIEKLEMKQYDTKPIWEQALAAILELRDDVVGVKTDVGTLKIEFGALKAEVAEAKSALVNSNESMAQNTADLANHTKSLNSLQSNMSSLGSEMQAGFTALRDDIEHGFRGIARKLDVINQNWFELKVDQRYLDKRLAYLEEQIKPS
jgi:chromosome segregation ATPase